MASAPRLGILTDYKAEGLSAINFRVRTTLCDIQRALKAAAFVGDFFLKLQNRIEQSFGAWRASWHVYVHGNHLVDALNDRVILEYAAGGRARTHRGPPLWVRH